MNSHEYVPGNIKTYEEWSSFKEVDMTILKQYAKKKGGEDRFSADICIYLRTLLWLQRIGCWSL